MPGSTASSQASIRSADGRPFAELVDAHKSYGDVQALKGVSLAVNAGELVAMLGPNGAGKTTAISLMTGLRKPTSGSARLFGLAPTDIRARSRMGVMLQESGVPLSLRVREIVDLFRTYYPRPLPTERVLEIASIRDLAIQNLSIRASTVELLTNEPEAVLKALFERGTQIRDLEVVGAGLEEAVLSLTEGRG